MERLTVMYRLVVVATAVGILTMAGCQTLRPRQHAAVHPDFTPDAAAMFDNAVPAPVAIAADDPFTPRLVGLQIGVGDRDGGTVAATAEEPVALLYAAPLDVRDGRVERLERVRVVDQGDRDTTDLATWGRSAPELLGFSTTGGPLEDVSPSRPDSAVFAHSAGRRWEMRWNVRGPQGSDTLPVTILVRYHVVGEREDVDAVWLHAGGVRFRIPNSLVDINNGLDERLFRNMAGAWWDGIDFLYFHNARFDLSTQERTEILSGVPTTFVDSVWVNDGGDRIAVIFGERRVSRELAVLRVEPAP